MNEQTLKPGVKTFSIPAKLVRAAMIFQARQDVRYYLNAIHINMDGHIEATNGHIMFRAECEEAKDLGESLIVSISGKVPARAHTAKFIFMDDERDVGLVIFEDGIGRPIRKTSVVDGRTFERVDGKFPDCGRIVPTDPLKPVEQFGVNASYIAKVAEAGKALGSGSPVVSIKLRGANEILEIDINSPVYNAKCLIMPVRFRRFHEQSTPGRARGRKNRI